MNVVSQKYDFDANNFSQCEQGAHFERLFVWKNKDNSVIDLTLWSAQMQVRRNYNEAILIELSTANNRISLSNIGEITLTLTATETGTLQAGTYKYDLELTDDVGNVYRLIEGKFVVSPQITK